LRSFKINGKNFNEAIKVYPIEASPTKVTKGKGKTDSKSPAPIVEENVIRKVI